MWRKFGYWIENLVLAVTVRHWKKSLAVLFLLGLGFWWILPNPLFEDPISVVVEDRNGHLLGARIASDGQWRFPHNDTVPVKFMAAITTFEDKRFFQHGGVDFLSMGRAMIQNIQSGSVVSGGSTLTMQVARLSRKGKSRNLWNKLVEAILAWRIEQSFSKQEILALYASHAPFGGNVVGLDAAAWRYFGREPHQLSWSECATLAVLPNSPSLVHPGKNRQTLKEKRDRLLDKLVEQGYLDSLACRLAKEEPLPGKPHILPNLAPHLTDRIVETRSIQRGKFGEKRFKTTVDAFMQQQVEEIVDQHHYRLKGNGVHNAAVLVMEVSTGDVIAYVGNTRETDPQFGSQVDVIMAPRSSGSILKPFLYAAMLDDGLVLPNSLVPDIPTYYGGYSPENFDLDYSGAIPAKDALARSLNIPAVRMLEKYGQTRFYDHLKKAGMTSLTRPASNYGLSLILGGAETKLWDLAGMYGYMARTVNEFQESEAKYDAAGYREPNWDLSKSMQQTPVQQWSDQPPILGAGAAYLTLEAMVEVTRGGDEARWRNFSSSRRIAWKTGTSFGFRDAWAIGCSPDYVVAVWSGNADGEGRPGLIGLQASAPILFDVFSILPHSEDWFPMPYDDLVEIPVCAQSGYRPLEWCKETQMIWAPPAGVEIEGCPYHKLVHLDPTGQFRVHSDCESPMNMTQVGWFVLPPTEESFFRRKNAQYRALPPYRADCAEMLASGQANMAWVYPKTFVEIYVPVNLDGSLGSTVFEITHRNATTKVYWHLDEQYVGTTEGVHQLALRPKNGSHILSVVDENGEKISQKFEIVSKSE